MKISRAGIDLIKRWEGCRLKAYQDPVGIWTIGYGHTSAAGKPTVTAGLTITQQQADDILVRDLVKYEAAVGKALTRTPSEAQTDAMISLCYNIGPAAFAGSTLVRRFNAGDIKGAADAFLMWNKAGGKVLKGLEARRADERKHFLSGAAKPVEPDKPAPVQPQPPAPQTPPPATAAPAASLAKWVIGLVGALVAILAAWMMKG